jgi:hypothetical protein
VVRDPQALRLRLRPRGLHQVAIHRKHLQAVNAQSLEFAHARARRIGRARRAARRVDGVDEEARRVRFARRARCLERERLARVAAHVADGRDAGGEPEFQLVVERLRHSAALLLHVAVQVDEAGHDVLARCVDLRVARGGPTCRAGLNRDRVERD